MRIHDEKLWKLVLEQKNSLVPLKYYVYKTAGKLGSYIAECRHTNTTGRVEENLPESPVVNIVDFLIDKGVKSLGGPPDNKNAVMCELQISEDEKMEVYFCSVDEHRVVCTEIVTKSLPISKKI